MNRVIFPETEYLLVASDLHGCQEDYKSVIQVYEKLLQTRKSAGLILLGDVIHGYPGYNDCSLSILTDIQERQQKGQNIIYIMGNHELAHVLHWDICKGNINFTGRMENDLLKENLNRHCLHEYLCSLPFIACTKNGIVLSHTGISAAAAGIKDEKWDFFLSIFPFHLWIQNLNFAKEFHWDKDFGKTFSPEAGEKNLDTPAGKILWEFFMNKNEHSYTKKYAEILQKNLQTYSRICPANILISGHIEEKNGFRVLSEQHLRLHTGRASTKEGGKILLIKQSQEIKSATTLTNGIIKY
jgi:UDP-2,3-diacylglucosamine pyrophosphatase LpxH